jgi:drug/metabolite transporter (DMT)-like permease
MKFALLGMVILSGAAGDLGVTRGMKHVGEVTDFHPRALLRMASSVFSNGWIWLGIFCKAIAFFTFLALLVRADLSWAVPAAASTYVVDTMAAKYILHESITPTRWAGALCVGLGVAFVSL